MRHAPRLARLLLLAAAALGGPARADIFSPGPLSRPHAQLEGLANCTKCHQAGEQLSQAHCLECHKELRPSLVAGKGLHGRIPPPERDCEKCHHEHQGREFKIVDWGAAGRKGFDHARTGYQLEGKHAKADCARCHDHRLVTDAAVRATVEKGRLSHLGTPVACGACHVDEHRGQLGPEGRDCARCHGAVTWKPARFDHARTAYKLEGKHAKVACQKCHADQPAAADEVPGGMVPPVRPLLLARYKPVPFQQCVDCHKKDPHQGRFGQSCQGCHSTEDWKKLHGSAREKVFHEKTRYPLRGAHLQVKCDACHLLPGKKAVYRGLAFERCTDCHFDAHLGQLASAAAPPGLLAAGARTCDRCHVVDAFLPVRYELEDHQQAKYKLEGAHRVVACAGCHPKDPRLEAKVPAAVRARLEAAGRPARPSLALLDLPRAQKDCRACHRDPHGGQFQARLDKDGCAGCHVVETFRKARFDHDKDSRYRLEGKHQKAACGSCHKPGDGGVVRYRPLPVACAGCHADVHAGQLAVKGVTDCARCHDAASWKEKLRFDHDKDSRYKLEGKHKPLACDKCHPLVPVAKGVELRRYRPLPLECQGCHADQHQGAFRGFKP
jgi:predicted CXXCH cytochrome family protein